MSILSNSQGFSRIEVVCIAGISCFAAALLAALGWFALSLMWQGNDANALNTAQGVANASSPSACLIAECPGAESAEHQKHLAADGSCAAYYSKGENTLTADVPAPYNEGDVLDMDGRQQHVDRASCIIRVTRASDGSVSADWVLATSLDQSERL